MNMNRRMFFKSMGAATVAAAPISSALANVVSPKKWDQTCEVLVIGAGAAPTRNSLKVVYRRPFLFVSV